MAKAKAKKKAPTRKNVVAKKSAPKKRTQSKRVVKKVSMKYLSANHQIRLQLPEHLSRSLLLRIEEQRA
jgi:hypothetical protein